MNGWWLGGWTVVSLVMVVNSNLDIDSALRLAHCRASCIHKMQFEKLSDYDCATSHQCSQCWNVCAALQVCNLPYCVGSCLDLCRLASAGYPTPFLVTRSSEELTITPFTVSWPPPPSSTTSSVYVVMVDHDQHLQTLDHSTSLPPSIDPLTVQVLVVDWRGLTEVFTPRPQSPLEQARDIVWRLGLEGTIGLSKMLLDQNGSAVTTKTVFDEDAIPKTWNLKESSKVLHVDFVKVQISWDSQQSTTTSQIYLVTWQEKDELLRGNLFTNSSSVSLSLQPNNVFRIQVAQFSLDSSNIQSEILLVDTHCHRATSQPHHNYLPPIYKASRVARWRSLVSASAVGLLATLLALTWRSYYQRFSLTLYGNTNREFSPVITLTTESIHNK